MRAAMGALERQLCVKIRWIGMSRADLLAVVVLLGVCGLWSGFTWGRLYDPIVDQGWQMQVAARVADGQVLYREVIWMYGESSRGSTWTWTSRPLSFIFST